MTGEPRQTRRFPFAFAGDYQLLALCFGITASRAWAEVGQDRLHVRFGPWRVSTNMANVAHVDVTGPYAFLKTAGPARLSVTDRGLTFATNPDRGVLVRFLDPVAGLEPTGRLRHPELTVTVADVDGFAALLRSRAALTPSS